jgi:hypothetical protein
MSPVVLIFGLWVMITGRIGRGPAPIQGPLAIALGAIFTAFAAVLFVVAWREPPA